MEKKEELEGKVALVTGGSRGIGSAIVEKLNDMGAAVVFNHHSRKGKGAYQAEQLKNRLVEKGHVVEEIVADLTIKHEIEKMFKRVEARFGKLDILVLNAAYTPFKRFEHMTRNDWKILINTTLMGNFHCLSSALPLIKNGGKIVCISSLGSRIPLNKYPLGPMKAALENFTRLWAVEFFDRKIRVNCVSGGLVNTENLDLLKKLFGTIKDIDKYIIQPKDIASVVGFLCSEAAEAISGEVITVDNGLFYSSIYHE